MSENHQNVDHQNPATQLKVNHSLVAGLNPMTVSTPGTLLQSPNSSSIGTFSSTLSSFNSSIPLLSTSTEKTSSSIAPAISSTTPSNILHAVVSFDPKVYLNLTSSVNKTVPISFPVDKNITQHYANLTSSLTMEQPGLQSSFGGLSFLFLGLLSIACIVIIFLTLVLVRKNRLDRLRHHLMPVYNFDPSEDGEDWETELLEEPFVSQSEVTKMTSIKLDSGLTGGLNIKSNGYTNVSTGNNHSNSKGNKPTATSGLLSGINNNGNHSTGHLYTNEKPVV